MESPLNSYKMFFVVNDNVTLDKFCEYCQRIGFTISEAQSQGDIVKLINNTSLQYSHISTDVKKDGLHGGLIDLMNCISPNISSVVIVLDDLSLMKICYNSQNMELDNHPTLNEIEKEHIVATLKKCGWSCKTAAKLLGINRTTIYRKMKKYGISKVK